MDLQNKFVPKGGLGSYRTENTGRGLSGKEGSNPSGHRSALNRFKKKTEVGKASPNQFKKYMLEANNVFYENRPELKNLEELKTLRWTLVLIWLLLAFSYFLVGRLEAYSGICPKNARCGVFIHCAEFFEYDPTSHSCILSSSIVHEIRQISKATIVQLQYNYGDNECAGLETVPSLNLNLLFVNVQDPEKRKHYVSEAAAFFKDAATQEEMGFTLTDSIVEPTVKLYSLSCRLTRFLGTTDNQVTLLYLVIGVIGVVLVGRWANKRKKIERMYNYLRGKVLSSPNETLNVTHAMGDLESQFGLIDEATWDKINDVRTKNKEIGYYQDDFLYWKKM